MKTININQGTDPNNKQPFPVGSLKFIQDATKEIVSEAIINLIGASYDPTKIYILRGCVDSGGGAGTFNISAGAVFYAGEVYQVDATGSFTPGGGNTAVATIVKTNPSPDPITFKGGGSYNVHDVFKVVIATAVIGSGISDFSAFKYANYPLINTMASRDASFTVPVSFAIVTSMTYTTPNDGITRRFSLRYKALGTVPSDASGTKMTIRIRNTTASTTLDQSEMSIGASMAASGSVLVDGIFDLAPNTTIHIEAQQTGSGGFGTLEFSKFTIEEKRIT